MKLAVVAQIRNEADILPAFAAHIAALFDYALLMDHGSVDGSEPFLAALCAGRPGWARWRIDVAGHHQAHFATFAAAHLFGESDADCVAFLDADEFVEVADRAALERVLAPLLAEPRAVPLFAWRNGLPRRRTAPLRFGAELLVADTLSPYRKAWLTRALFAASGGRAAPLSGAHGIDPGDGGAVTETLCGSLLHLPLRSLAQCERKMVLGSLAALARADRPPNESLHWIATMRRIAAGGLDDADLPALVARYGLDAAASEPTPALRSRRFEPPHVPLRRLPPLPARPVSPWRIVAAALQTWEVRTAAALPLALAGDRLHDAGREMPGAADGAAEDKDAPVAPIPPTREAQGSGPLQWHFARWRGPRLGRWSGSRLGRWGGSRVARWGGSRLARWGGALAAGVRRLGRRDDAEAGARRTPARHDAAPVNNTD